MTNAKVTLKGSDDSTVYCSKPEEAFGSTTSPTFSVYQTIELGGGGEGRIFFLVSSLFRISVYHWKQKAVYAKHIYS
jgi:hypothetical protein